MFLSNVARSGDCQREPVFRQSGTGDGRGHSRVNLDGTTGVSFGDGVTVNSFAEQSAESVVASVTIGVSASLGGGRCQSARLWHAVLPNAFSVTAELPTIADVSPLSGKVGQTLSLSITGANLGSTGVSVWYRHSR